MTAFGLDLRFAAEALWKVLVAGLVLGAGLPAVFAVGIRGLAMAGDGGTAADGEVGSRPNPLGNVLAAVMFLVVAYGIVAGLLFIIASGQGKDLTFDHIVPWIEPKS
ncbi:hypothetical protein [Nocardioides ultimimeridianus]